ncbi:MAG: transcriptional repressor LexA [gamma proteobacterium endosymbiont of Lamellibrachia anaximandri]|nr:transcriptional repressor LexA [gamma proteobacterium endosymbiont of Lamellibrachia anaximandri]
MLTNRQQTTFQFIRNYHLRHGYAPKLTEIANGIGISSKGVVHRYLKAIAEEGLIDLLPGRHRGIRLTKECQENYTAELTLPLLGKIAAGQPIEAIPNHDSFNLTAFFLGTNRFVLKVQGDSMIEAGILDGDMVIIEQQSHAKDGEIVIALIDNDEATLKYLQQNNDETVTLLPANRSMQPMNYSVERIQIQGIVVGQMRSYETAKTNM